MGLGHKLGFGLRRQHRAGWAGACMEPVGACMGLVVGDKELGQVGAGRRVGEGQLE